MVKTDDGLKPLEIRHDRAREILGIASNHYWRLVRDGLIKTVGWGSGSRAVYASIEAYHRSRIEAPKKTLKMVEARNRQKANRELAVE